MLTVLANRLVAPGVGLWRIISVKNGIYARAIDSEVGPLYYEGGLFYDEVRLLQHEVGLLHHEVGLLQHEVGPRL